MMNFIRQLLFLLFSLILYVSAHGQALDGYSYNGKPFPDHSVVTDNFQFNGYTNYWHDISHDWIRYGNLFKVACDNVDYTIAQSKRDIAEDIGISGLSVQEGFMNSLLGSHFEILDQPSLSNLERSAEENNILVLADLSSETGKKLASFYKEDQFWKNRLKSHQLNASDYVPVNLFILEKGERKIYMVSSSCTEMREKTLALILSTKDILEKYDLHRGWFGAGTLLKSVTLAPGHPLEVIGRGMNEGNSWFTFSGYMDYLIKDELENWLKKVDLPVVTDVGAFVGYVKNISTQAVYGCDNYDGLQPQNMYTMESWLNFANSRNGYAFRSVYDRAADMYHYDGYIAGEGNKEQIDNENVPFVTTTGYLENDAVLCMVLFTGKGEKFDRQQMWQAIMDRREVAVLGKGKMMGPVLYRNVLELLLLDREFLEEYFGDRIILESFVEGYKLTVNITNVYNHAVSGILSVTLPPGLKMDGDPDKSVILPPGGSQTLNFQLDPSLESMAQANPVAVRYRWEKKEKNTLAILDLPPVISVHQLLYGHSPDISFPVSVHNYTEKAEFPVKIEVLENNTGKVVFSDSRVCRAERGSFADTEFTLKIPSGNYNVTVTALGSANHSQLGAGRPEGHVTLTEADLNADGVNEYILENDSVKVTLLTTGARIIEYYVKSRKDNVLFKLWPGKPVDDKREFRKRNYYPFGGFEEFLGQASMETHKVYNAEILKKEGDYVRIRMTADYFGNRLEKTFTLYGNSPLLEVRYAFDFINPEANVIAPVPILALGKKQGTEDIFTVPEKNGLKEYRMNPDIYAGQVIFPSEGWDAGYDPYEDVSFVGAFPVSRPIFLHMFQNLATNGDAHYDFNEFQPWVPIIHKITSYFTYYLWGEGGNWKIGLKELRERNLITVKR
jgi:hypothetical protein